MATAASAAFFSYSRDDSEFALRLAGDLKAAGATVWLDQLDISPGQLWDREVEDALTHCPRMIVILSPSSVTSTNVMDEVSFALENQKSLIPVLYRDCAIPFRMRRVQYADFRLDYAKGLKDLLQTLKVNELLPPPTPPISPLPSPAPPTNKWAVVALAVTIAISAGVGTYAYYQHQNTKEAFRAPANRAAVEKAAEKAPANRADSIGSGILIAENTDGKGKLVLLDPSRDRVASENAFGGFITCLAKTRLGQIIVCDQKRIVKMARSGQVLLATNGEFSGLAGATESNDGNLLLSFGSNHSVRQMDWNGQTTWSVSNLHFPTDAQGLPDGNTLVADGTSELKIVAGNGQIVQTIPLSSWAIAVNRLPNGFTIVGLSGSVVLLDQKNNTVWNTPSVSRPSSVEQMSSGDILVADPDNGRVIILERKTGKISWSRGGLEGLVRAVELQ